MTRYFTGNPVGSADPRDLYDNAENLDRAINGVGVTWNDRLGKTRISIPGAIKVVDDTVTQIKSDAQVVLNGVGYLVPVPYAEGISVDSNRITVEYDGSVYAPVSEQVPFITGEDFDSSQWRLIQGIAFDDLAAGDGAAMVGFFHVGSGAVPVSVTNKLRELPVSPMGYGAVGDGGADDTEAVELAVLTGRPVLIDRNYRISRTIACGGLSLIGRGGSITGGDFLGFLCSGSVDIGGDITISGFGDGSEDQKSNFSSAFCRLETGYSIDHVYVTRGVKVSNCRAFITAGSLSNDFTADPSISVGHLHVEGILTDRVMQVIMLRCIVVKATGGFNTITNCIGAARTIGGFIIFMDGLGNGNPAYEMQGSRTFIGDTFRNIVNRTTTGDSTTGNNYETHAYQISGRGVFITDPDCENITGTAYDCEAVYTKAFNTIVRGGRFRNAGTLEGSIVIKGAPPGATVTNNATGGKADVSGVIIEYDRYAYDNAGTEVILRCRGVTVDASYDTKIDARIIGANAEADVVVNGYLDADSSGPQTNRGVSLKIESERSRSNGCVLARGAFYDLDVWTRAVDVQTSGGNWTTIRHLSVASRGIANRNHRYWHLTHMRNTSLSGFWVHGIMVDNQEYDFNGLVANDCVWDVVAPGATIRPFYFDANGASPVGRARSIEICNWTFVQPLTTLPVLFDGVFQPDVLKIDLQFKRVLSDNSAVTAAQAWFAQGSSGTVSVEGSLSRVDVAGSGIYQPKLTGVYYGTTSAVSAIAAATGSAAIGNVTSSTSISMDTNARYVRARLNGNDGETYIADIRFKADISNSVEI